MPRRLPIIYVRGFVGSGVDKAVEDPFQGFNTGSTHVRVGEFGNPAFYQFESPLLRLMLDHDYNLFVKGGQLTWLQRQEDGSVDPATIWVHRFYDISSASWGGVAEKFRIENAAASLLELIDLVRAKTGAPRVHLVAHSMGGLVCRCAIQKLIPERGEQATDIVERLFTYATPHGGIEFGVGFGLLERVRDTFDVAGAAIFGPERMWEYLNPAGSGPMPTDWRPGVIPDDVFPNHRVFTLVGTNSTDYDTALGIPAAVVGPKSDGVVQIENAYVPGARFAYVYRTHSGRYGIVNSEEGYQNLRRFLFGDLEVTADLVGAHLPDDEDVTWQAEVEVAVRGLPILMHQQVARHHCPVILEGGSDASDRPQPLVTTFLIADPRVRPPEEEKARYTLHVRVLSLRQRRGIFDFRDHLEDTADFDDHLVVDIGAQDGKLVAWAQWTSELGSPLRDYSPGGAPLEDEEPAPGMWIATVPLPSAGTFLGERAAIRLTVRDRDDHGRAGLSTPGIAQPLP